MLLEEFLILNIGDIVYNIFKEKLIINQINVDTKNNEYNALCFDTSLTIDSSSLLNTIFFVESYPYTLLYTNFDDLCDNEKAFIVWANHKKNELVDLYNNNLIEKIQTA